MVAYQHFFSCHKAFKKTSLSVYFKLSSLITVHGFYPNLQYYFNYIVAASAPTHAFLEFFFPALCTRIILLTELVGLTNNVNENLKVQSQK